MGGGKMMGSKGRGVRLMKKLIIPVSFEALKKPMG
jgi:hypothetical protein